MTSSVLQLSERALLDWVPSPSPRTDRGAIDTPRATILFSPPPFQFKLCPTSRESACGTASLNALRARENRRETAWEGFVPDPLVNPTDQMQPEHAACSLIPSVRDAHWLTSSTPVSCRECFGGLRQRYEPRW